MISEEIRSQFSLKYNYLLQSIKSNNNASCNIKDLWKDNSANDFKDDGSFCTIDHSHALHKHDH